MDDFERRLASRLSDYEGSVPLTDAPAPASHRVPTTWAWAGAVAVLVLAVAVGLVGSRLLTGVRPSGLGSPTPAVSDVFHRQAQAALERWALAVAAAPRSSVVITGDATGQIGDWEEPVAENNKLAVMSGVIVAPNGLPTTKPQPAPVTWSDGSSEAVPLLSADAALSQIIASAASQCPECQPVEITGATLGTASVQTSRGTATVPVWEFAVAGSEVKVTRVAIASSVTVTPPAWDPDNPPQGMSIERATGTPQSTKLTVSFVGAPIDALGACGADYTAEAVESDLAIVVIVTAHPHPAIAGASGVRLACRDVGAPRTATVTLGAPLGARAVLEVREGLPVPVSPQ